VELALEHDLSIAAQELGYSDQAYFTRDFKAIIGRSPFDYRRLVTSGESGGLAGLGGNSK
jgi:AraC-like DNA-binding protein